MGTLLTVAGWLTVALCAAVAVSWGLRIVTANRWKDPREWITPLPFALAAVVILTLLGVIVPLSGGMVAGILAAGLGVVLWRSEHPPHYLLRWHVAGGFGYFGRDIRGLWTSLGQRLRQIFTRDGSEPAEAPAPADPADPAVRAVPSLRDDPALGPPPPPHEIAAASEVPVPWAELASWIAGFHPEDDNQQSWFIHGNAAGLVAIAHALTAHAEIVTNDIGLDPAYGGAVLELADLVAQPSGDAALVDKRYHLIYGDTKQAVDNGLILPHNARQWFGGAGTGNAA